MNFLNTLDSDLDQLINSALRCKHGDSHAKSLSGKSVALVFFNPSLRTRASMQVGIYELGGNAVVLEPGGTSWTLEHREGAVMDSDKTEHIAEFVRVLERYCVAIGVRTLDRKSTRLNSSHSQISYAVFCLKKKITTSASRMCAIHYVA